MIPQNCVEKRYENIIKSPNDTANYRGLLLTNKLKVLLISNPTTDKSGAALNVHIGHSSNPDDLPGLAHFCEHMLFLGTEKYPQKNEFNTFLSQNGGTYNAETDMDHTTYYFNVYSEQLEEALDRFAQFFVAPLFEEDLTELELNAVHLEYENNIANDIWRFRQLEKSAANPNHPFSKFGTGNRETLSIIPKQKNINVREKLFEFYDTYYSANVMALCVLGKESLDELEEIILKLFSHIKNKEIEIPARTEHPFSEEDFQTKWYIVPIKNSRHLNITFPLPDLRAHYKFMPAFYSTYLLGHEGKGSLLSLLKENGWCSSLEAGKRLGGLGVNFFDVTVDLTEEGSQHVDDIILMTFQYINMLKKHGPVEWIYNEYRDIRDMNFRFKENTCPLLYTMHLAYQLHNYPMEEVLVARSIFMSPWDPDSVKWIMEYLVPEKVRIFVIGQSYESICNETEKWYGTKFKKEKIPQSTIDRWDNAGLNSKLQLSPKNEFIAKRFDLKPQENVTKYPVIIEDTPLMRLWFKQDDEFLVPKANLLIDFVSPLAYIDPLSYTLTYMFVQLLNDSLNEYAYDAIVACLTWEISYTGSGITIAIGGYDDKQQILLEAIMDKMINFEIDPKRFETLKENYCRALANFETRKLYQHTDYYLAVLLSEHVWTINELLKATSQLTIERAQQFIPQFLTKVHMECLIHGNITKSEAIEVAKLVESKLTSAIPQIVPLLPGQMILHREIKLEDGCHFLYQADNKFHKSTCTEVYYQIGVQSTESNMLTELLAQIIAEPCFTTLRTKQQLGYIVYSGVRKAHGVLGLKITLQSDRHPEYVERQIDAFMKSTLKQISTMSEEEFNRHKESLATRRLEKPKTLTSLFSIFWSEISLQQYHFDRANIEVAHLRTIKQAEVLQFLQKMLEPSSQRKLSIHIISTIREPLQPIENDADVETELNKSNSFEYKKIQDITEFKISQSLYPLLKPFNNIPRKGLLSSKL